MKRLIAIGAAAVVLTGLVWWSIKRDESLKSGPDEESDNVIAQSEPAEETEVTVSAKTGYYDGFRAERNNTRELEIGYLDEIISVSSTDQETLDDAQERKLDIVEGMEKEFSMESLIKAKGFKDAAVTFNKGTVTVVVNAQSLSDEDVARILEIVCTETGVETKNVKVMTNPE